MKRRGIWIGGGIVVVALLVWFFAGGEKKGSQAILKNVKNGLFEVKVTNTGELRAKNSINIIGPSTARKAGIWQLKITRLVPEGTVVKKGDFVAELDKSEIVSKINEVEINLTKFQSQYTQAKLDCTLTLSQARDDLINLKYGMEQRKLEKEEAIYEAPSTQRQAEIEYEKSQRTYNQALSTYKTKVAQAEAKMREAEADLFQEQRKKDEFVEIINDFSILAPENGMVIYFREWDGDKRTVGSSFSTWQPTVATLPDLSIMESITYVNEVDIQKIKAGQEVAIGLDADSDKKLTGTVTSVANIGETQNNSDSKVFEVHILINEKDSTLRPAMTTSNEIQVAKKENTDYIELECIHSNDSLSYVYKKDGGAVVMQEVILGKLNDNYAEILVGLQPKDEVYFSMPAEIENLKMIRIPEELRPKPVVPEKVDPQPEALGDDIPDELKELLKKLPEGASISTD